MVTRVCVCVCVCVSVSDCLSAAVRPHYCTDPDVTWRRGRNCPLVVHYWADLQSVHGLRLLWQHNANPSYKLASIPWYDNIVRTLGAGGVCARDGGRSQNCAPYMGSGRGWLAGNWPAPQIRSTILALYKLVCMYVCMYVCMFSTLLRRPGLRASNGGVLAT